MHLNLLNLMSATCFKIFKFIVRYMLLIFLNLVSDTCI